MGVIMKAINVTFTDAEFRRLMLAKKTYSKTVSWHQFIINKCCVGISEKRKPNKEK